MTIGQRLLLLPGLLCLAADAAANRVVFAGGSLWCMEADFDKLDGGVFGGRPLPA